MWVQRTGGGVGRVAYSSDGRTLLTHDGGGWVYAWDVAARARRKLFPLDYNDRGSVYGFFVAGDYLILAPSGRTRVWDLNAGAFHTALSESPGYGWAHPPAAGTAVHFVRKDRAGVDTYDVPTGRVVREVDAPPGLGPVHAFAVAPNGDAVMVNGSAKAVVIRAGGEVITLPNFYGSDIRFSPDGKTLLWLHGGVSVWNAADLTVRVENVPCNSPHSGIALHPTLPVFAARNDARNLVLFSLDTGEPLRTLDLGIGFVKSIAFSPDGLTCAVGGWSKQFAVFDLDL
jgi:WD40 repeat protein